MQAQQVLGDFLHRLGGVAQRRQIALDRVELVQHVASRLGPAHQLAFQRLKAFLHAFDHRAILVDDQVEHQIQCVGGAGPDAVGAALQPLADALIAAAVVVPNGDQPVAANEQMGLAKLDARFPQLRGARGDEQMAFVFFQFGALVGGDGVFQRQRMQAEFLSQAGDGLAVGGFQFNPDEAVRLPDMVADVVECDRLGLVFGKEQAVDDGLQLRREMCTILVHAIHADSILEACVRYRGTTANGQA